MNTLVEQAHHDWVAAYFDAIPWPQFVLACLLGFIVGATLGIAYGRANPRLPSRETKGPNHD